jgi:NAD(P)-dependent dehydrogenase (short-subunit alcohol dehydrogenase family)
MITGASKGVGRATAISFAQAGAAGIALGARSDFSSLETEIEAAAIAAGKKPPQVLQLNLDVTNETDAVNAAKEVEKAFGKLDILFNNAGYLSSFKLIGESQTDEYWKNYEVNIKGIYLVTKAFLPLILKGGEKTIVNISSRGAHALSKGASGYQNTKFAVIRFTEYLMADYADQGLLAYAVHPCGATTDLSKNMPANMKFCKFFPKFVNLAIVLIQGSIDRYS